VKRLAIGLRLALLIVVACGDNHKSPSDAPAASSDGGSGSGAGETLTAYVIDLVTNHTTATELPQPYAAFSSLPDPDGDTNNVSAYSSLF
jgi:hypothetical protein